jgi:hypothetical protein
MELQAQEDIEPDIITLSSEEEDDIPKEPVRFIMALVVQSLNSSVLYCPLRL